MYKRKSASPDLSVLNISSTSEEFFQADDALPTCEEQDVDQLSGFTDSDRDPVGDDPLLMIADRSPHS
jgi:hypothetical protein